MAMYDPRLKAEPGVDLQPMADILISYMGQKKQNQDEKAKRRLDLWMKTGEVTGEFEQPTPDIQKAFRRTYGEDPEGFWATGGQTLAGKKEKAETEYTKAKTGKENAMADYYKTGKKSNENTNAKALDYAVKYANAKLGKPFATLSEDEREQWMQYHDEGKAEYSRTSGSGMSKPTVTDEQKKAYNRARSEGKSSEEARKIAGF